MADIASVKTNGTSCLPHVYKLGNGCLPNRIKFSEQNQQLNFFCKIQQKYARQGLPNPKKYVLLEKSKRKRKVFRCLILS